MPFSKWVSEHSETDAFPFSEVKNCVCSSSLSMECGVEVRVDIRGVDKLNALGNTSGAAIVGEALFPIEVLQGVKQIAWGFKFEP